ncbi:hypothetical protein CTI14_40560, partial [Methylobacterium radiotolerans]
MNAGANVGPWRLRHAGSATHGSKSGLQYQSVQTNLRRNITGMKSQLVIGDAFTDGSTFDSVGFRGVQMSSDDRMSPESQRARPDLARHRQHYTSRADGKASTQSFAGLNAGANVGPWRLRHAG